MTGEMFSDAHKNGEPRDNYQVEINTPGASESQHKPDTPQPAPTTLKSQTLRSSPLHDERQKRLLDEAWLAQERGLIARVVQGDVEALEKLYETYLAMVYSYIFKRVRNEAEAQDLTSDIFTRAIKSLLLGRYKPQEKPFGAWLSGIARRVYAEWVRARQAKYATTPLEELNVDQHVSTNEDVLETLIRQEKEALGWQLIKTLPLIDQQILILRHQYHLSHAEIGLRLGLTEDACKQRHHRAQRLLREKLRQFENWD